jgi:hypothetical protein
MGARWTRAYWRAVRLPGGNRKQDQVSHAPKESTINSR